MKTALLVPCYNSEKYLVSLKKQIGALDPKFDEVILVDDGSTDRTVEKAREHGLAIRTLGTNRGPGGARNALLQMTEADWIHFLDADDEIAPHYLGKVLPRATSEVDVVLSSCDFVGAVDRKFWIRWEYDDLEFRKNALAAAIAHPIFLHCSLIRRSKALEAGGFDEKHRCYEDGDFHVRLAAAGARFRCFSDILAVSPRHFEGSGGNELYCEKCRLEFLKGYLKYRGRVPADVLAEALALCGSRLHRKRDFGSSREAFDLAFRLGWKGPLTKNILMRVLAVFPGRSWRRHLYLAQQRVRTAGA